MQIASKSTVRLFILLLLAGTVLLSLPRQARTETATIQDSVRVVILRNSPPLQFFDNEKSRPSGFAVDVFDRVATEAGLRFTYVLADTWSEMINMILNGQADVVASLAISENRRKQLAFSEVIHSTPISMFTRSESTEIKGLAPGLLVGTTEGSLVVDFLSRQSEVEIRLHKTVPEGVFALLAGRNDAFVAADWLVLKELRDANIEDRISMLDEPLFAIKRAIAVRPGNSVLLERLNQGISTLINSPDYRDIYVRWYGKPPPYLTAKQVLILMSFLLAASVAFLGGWRMLTVRRLNLALRESEGRFRQAMDATSDGLWDWDLENERVYFNPNYYRMLGYEPDSFPAAFESWEKLVHGDDKPEALAVLQGQINNDTGRYETEFRMRTKDGNWKWILSRGEATSRDGTGRALRMIGTHVDITAKKNAEEVLKNTLQIATDARDRVDAILESVSDALIVTDPEQRVVLMNKAAEYLIGQPRSEVKGRPIGTVISEPTLLGQLGALSKDGDKVQRNDFELHHAGRGEKRHLQAQSSPVLTQNGLVTGVITLLRDVTQEKELDQMKNEFISIAAHELKTPLTVVIGYSELLLNETTDNPFDAGQRRDFLTSILNKGETLERLIDDLLSLSRIESGHPLALDLLPCDLKELLCELVPHHQLDTEYHQFKLDLPSDPVILLLDRVRIEQAFDNLLSNARKYSPEGGTIRITLRREKQDVLITVADEGIGMTPEQTRKVFDKFYRANNLDTAVRGLGLGMNIVKNIIEAHNGDILVESKLGRGSQMYVRLPIEEAE